MKQKLLYLFLFLTINTISFAQVANQPSDLVVCDDDNDGFSQFDLTILDAQVLDSQDPTGFVLSYHVTLSDANNGINALPIPYGNITPWLQTIYIRLEDSVTGNFDTTLVNLIINPFPQAIQPTSLNLCDDIGEVPGDGITVFDLTVKDAEITGGNADWSVDYYETNADAQAQTNAIANPTVYTNNSVNGSPANPQTLFVVVTDTNTGCINFTTLTIRVFPNPSPTPSELLPDLVMCDETNPGDGIETFDLTENEIWIINGDVGHTVTYYTSENNALSGSNSISDPTQFTNTVSTQTIYARMERNTTGCFAVVDFDITVYSLPEVVAINDFILCELYTDGFANFNLALKDVEVLNGQDSSQFDVNYYMTIADAESGTNALLSPYTNLTNPQQIFVTITNTSTGCSISTQSFNIEVNEAAQANSDFETIIYEQCDDNMETDGDPTNDSIQFDLTTQDAQVLDGQNPTDYIVTYYATEIDANFGINPLPILYSNVVNPQVIYVRVDNNTENGSGIDSSLCYATTDVTLQVNPLPFLNIDDSYSFCIGESVTIDTGLNASDYSFQWATDNGPIPGETQSSLTVSEPGFYYITVVAFSGCGTVSTMINVEEMVCTDTDSDGVIDADEDINENGNLEDDDTDGDDIPNYLDDDDDGDGVDTIIEISIELGRNAIHPFVDTDGDDIENYLDDDDDGDGILTVDEDYNNNGDPTDDDTNTNGIPDYLENDVALGVDDYSVVNFKLFPNPAKNTVSIQLTTSNLETGKINIIDIQGKTILKDITLLGQSSTLDISSLESGLYFVKLTINNAATIEKLIVN
ncbi:T9SS type A sorting domain-containing protein [Winogradskyella arenosi]|uniref:Putative secreted protein (Por secretion system target) n=1 Tax=Winogradskyella arenosi TaxID=533325 RepID=A0A368ZFM2_9FLAO|nr:T9SS type A sorting domain-containing protein [Winogradskyella arenosi]RCW92243.1 putative secreted protein (Por secretion system target) [Winogradskyella arenosi]